MADGKRIGTWTLALNWGLIQDQVESVLGIVADQESIEESLEIVEKDYQEAELLEKDGEELEQLLVNRLLKILRKKRGKEIKKQDELRKRSQKNEEDMKNMKVGIQIFDPTTGGEFKDLKDLDIDPEVFEQISKGLMDNMFGQKKTKRKDSSDDDKDEEPGSSFYL
jgi:hypothetical protein